MESYNINDTKTQDLLSSLEGLRSTKSTHRLNQIASSAGKSSILEGITGFPFPRQDGVCTKFATEIILHHDAELTRIVATILPHKSRSEGERQTLQAYHRVLNEFSELPNVITEAGALMQINQQGGHAFAEDVLRIDVLGNTGLHLTIVDLPGLIANPSDDQNEDDVKLVSRLVDSYLESSRTIILAVVQASNDIANQGIIRRCRTFDPAGQRTVGILTKPDLINKGTEGRVALLAKNEDTTKLKLGYFLLKNPTPEELKKGITLSERSRLELEFFSSPTWKTFQLEPDRIGVCALREFLQDLLNQHIERELPKVRKEIQALLEDTEAKLGYLGDERPNVASKRIFLTRRSMEFHRLVQAALDGNYNDTMDYSMRLRAEVHRLNANFADQMRNHGQSRKVCSSDSPISSTDPEITARSASGPTLVSQEDFDVWVKQVYSRTRGRELPGNYNHALLSELFHEQSSRWPVLSRNHVDQLFSLTTDFVKKTLIQVVPEEETREKIQSLCLSRMEDSKHGANIELQKLLTDEMCQPITYNHYYTDNIQRARQDTMKGAIAKAMRGAIAQDWGGKLHVSNTPIESEKLLQSLQTRVIVDMDKQACAEAVSGLDAYYKVAMKTFVDNVCRQVVERHLLSSLSEIFDPTAVMKCTDEELEVLASEPEKQKQRRANLVTLAEGLRDSLRNLRN